MRIRNAPNGAKTDLKKQLKNFKVRPAIEQAIVKELAPTSSAAPSQQEEEPSTQPAPRSLAASVSSLSSERPITPMLDNRPDQVDPVYVNTQRELDDIFKEMQQHFEGKETEQNWLKREESITKLRKLLAGNAASDFPDAYINGARAMLDGIIKAIITLRTSLSKEGCSLVQDIANRYGSGMDPMVELLMQTFIKLAAATKKISSQLANITVDTLIAKTTYNARIMQHIWGACQDKNLQPRTYATGWLKTLINKEANHKNQLEHSGGLDLVEKCIKKGLADPNPGVREKMRATYWTFAGIWPARAEAIMDGLDTTAQKLLQNDANNPNSPKKSAGPVRPGLGLSKSTMGSKPSLRETMMAQKKAMTSKNLPARPGSAMSHFSPVKTTSTASSSATPAVRQRPESTIAGAPGGLSVAPMRPTKRRPELAARPATAGPYSVRGLDQPSTEQSSPPAAVRTKSAVTPRTLGASPKRTTAQRPRSGLGHAATASESSIHSPTRLMSSKSAPVPSPRNSPVKAKAAAPAPVISSPTRANEDLTMVVPTVANLRAAATLKQATPPKPTVREAPASPLTPTRPLKVYEDPMSNGQTTPKPSFTGPVLEDKPINEDAGNLVRTEDEDESARNAALSPDKARQNSRLLDSGISKIKQTSLDVHGFRKLQGIIRDSKATFTDAKFEELLIGLFEFLESAAPQVPPEKVQDVKAQVLATIKLLLKKMRDNFQPHVSRGLESMLRSRAAYDGRTTHMVSGLELLADELAGLGDPSELTVVLTRLLAETTSDDAVGARSLSIGMHVLKEMVDVQTTFEPNDAELASLAGLASRCLESTESGVRMDAVQLCVALHARVGDQRFWDAMKGAKDDPKSLITYYIVKRQRESQGTEAA
jgi:CLIP-associating protein 1/2